MYKNMKGYMNPADMEDKESALLPQVGSCDIFDLLNSEIQPPPPEQGVVNSSCTSNVSTQGQGLASSQTKLTGDGISLSPAKQGGSHRKNKGPLPLQQHETHRIAQKRRRDNLKQKIKILQELLPDCTKKDTISILDEAIKRIRLLKNQLEWLKLQASTMALQRAPAALAPIPTIFYPTITVLPPQLPPHLALGSSTAVLGGTSNQREDDVSE